MRAEFRRNVEHRVALPPPSSAVAAAIAAAQLQRHHQHRRHADRVAVRVSAIVAPPRDSLLGRGDRVRHLAGGGGGVALVRFRSGFYALRTCPVGFHGGRASAATARVHRTTW